MNKRIYYFDIIRFIAMTAVILNHSCGYFSFDNFDLYVGQPIYFIDCIINSLTRFNVPFFLMLSGGLILSSEKSTDVSYILHKTRRIIILLVFWTFSYSVIQLFSYSVNIALFVKNLISSIFHANSYAGHLWYLYTTIVVYMLTPILSYSLKNNLKYTITIIVCLALFFDFLCPMARQFINLPNFAGYFSCSFISGYLLYYVIGFLLVTQSIKIRKRFLFLIIILSGLSIGLLTILISLKMNRNFYYLQNFNSPLVLIYSIALFLLIKESFQNSNKEKEFIIRISDISLGMYLVHFFFRDLYMNLIKNGLLNEWVYLILSPVLVFVSSFLLVFLFRKNKKYGNLLLGIK